MKLEKMNKNERSLLLFLETCAVDQGGRVDTRCMNSDDVALAKTWNESGFVEFGRIQAKDIFHSSRLLTESFTHWCQLSDDAWRLAHEERRARAKRVWEMRTWRKTKEKDE